MTKEQLPIQLSGGIKLVKIKDETPTPLQHVEANMARRIRFAIEGWTNQAEAAREAVAENKNSDWALMEDLAKAYGFAPMVFSLTRHVEYVEAGRGTWLETMTRLRDSLMHDLVSARISNSTSGAANLISEYKLQGVQAAFELVDGWVNVLKAAQPAS